MREIQLSYEQALSAYVTINGLEAQFDTEGKVVTETQKGLADRKGVGPEIIQLLRRVDNALTPELTALEEARDKGLAEARERLGDEKLNPWQAADRDQEFASVLRELNALKVVVCVEPVKVQLLMEAITDLSYRDLKLLGPLVDWGEETNNTEDDDG